MLHLDQLLGSAPSDLLLDVVRLTNVLTYLLTYATYHEDV